MKHINITKQISTTALETILRSVVPRFADIGIYGGPKISKLGHMTQATPTWGRFMVHTQVYYKKNLVLVWPGAADAPIAV